MRILNIPEATAPTQAATPPAPVSSGPEVERVEALENVAKSILEKMQAMEERVKLLESSSPAVSGPTKTLGGDGVRKLPPVTMDADALKKNLLIKMWNYLNDKAAA